MRDEQFTALRMAAGEGVSVDGLSVVKADDGYRFETPDVEARGLSEDDLRAVAADEDAYVTNWYFWRERAPDHEDHRAFLRWLERADERPVPDRYDALSAGRTRTWGQLAITATLDDDGERRYDLRHEADRARSLESLTVREDPQSAREIATYDDDGRYRPLATATSLRTGWVFPGLPASDLVAAVEHFYPATVSNWYRERTDDLDVTHWRETAARQTGIYDVVADLPDEAVAWLAEACCVDSQCCKRRRWDLDAETPLSVPRGDGEFPCREPCSLVIAAAREWTRLEREQPRTYEFRLTPSEKDQLETILDAVADGRVGEIREADFEDGANRYRARYVRAKLFDDEGNLDGVSPDE
ncbi:MAG: DR2241 family protein [Haloarculaceae archaeon]